MEALDSSLGETEPMAMDIDTTTFTFTPTEYELKVYEVAMRRNTIAVLETEGGRSMIAVMMIREMGRSLKQNNLGKKLIVFLAPTVHLVHQQYKEIKSHTELDVEEYYGAKGVDDWDAKTWEKEINKNDVLVMTPQVLVDALKKGYLCVEAFCLIVLDECHRATGNHPYAKVMEFYHKSTSKPKILGITASSVIRKGISSAKESNKQIMELESILDSQIYTTKETMEIEDKIPTVKQMCRFYDPVQSQNPEIQANLKCSWSKFDALLRGLETAVPSHNRNADAKDKTLRERLADDHESVSFCLENLGLICAYEAVKVCIENAPCVEEEPEFYKESIVQYRNCLQELISIIENSLLTENKKLLDVDDGGSDALSAGQISPKLHELLEIFRSFGESKNGQCIVFVERMIAAKVIERVVKTVADLSHFNVSYLTGPRSSVGVSSPEALEEIMESSKSGKVNIFFSTDMVEEGINVPGCSSVIHFDLPTTVSSYVQSRGRACQGDSHYIIMLERGNRGQIDHVTKVIKSENCMAHTAIDRGQIDHVAEVIKNENCVAHTAIDRGLTMKRDPDSGSIKVCETQTATLSYIVESTGASVTPGSSISLIQKYCEKLPRDKYFTPKPKFESLPRGNSHRCKLILPPNAAFQTIIGPEARNFHLSKQLVCLDACQKLHMMGDLNDNLLPCNEDSSQNESTSVDKVLTSGAGTTKRKELHGSVNVRMLSGTWGDRLDGVSFHAYKMDFSCNIVEERYSSFILLMEAKLDDDVGNTEVQLYLIAKSVGASVSFCGQLYLDAQQVTKAKCFQELMFNGLFGKLFFKSSGVRKFLLQTDESLWNPSSMYLLLPLGPAYMASQGGLAINWRGIESCVSAVEFLKTNAWLNFQLSESIRENSSDRVNNAAATKSDSHVIHLANMSVSVDDLKEMVVVAIHTGRIYSILESVVGTSAESPFEATVEADYSSYADYYRKKYGFILKYPEQSLLLLKQSHNSHNLLVDFRSEEGGSRTNNVPKLQQHAHIPPELLVGTDLRNDVLKSFYLLPSLMHRLESLMLASQLREEIALYAGNLNISSSLILEALTTLTCNESFSMERLELLGDSVLKYAVSCHLFLKYPKKHEGQLSAHRSSIVSNSALHKFGTHRKLQGYIRDCAFDPRRWTAPGQRSIWPSACKHGVDTVEVPLDSKFFSEDIKLMIGKTCDRGHRWMGSKTISDCVEALIGAYYLGGGLNAACHLMKWLGIEVGVEPSLIDGAIKAASLHSYAPKAKDIEILESKLGYEFLVKALLLEAITHGTEEEQNVGYCYQRLEFLGDSVLDILMTCHHYENYTDVDPGELTDLRSASVNNDNFAIAAVRGNLHPHLQHGSLHLENQISEFVKLVSSVSNVVLTPDTKGPKVLGDLVESIAGAILIDTKLDLDKVWEIFKPLLSPIVTPDKLELPPSRELIELCDSLGFFMKELHFPPKGDAVQVRLKLQLPEDLLVADGSGPNRKAARGMAALQLLKELEARDIISSKRKKYDTANGDAPFIQRSDDSTICKARSEASESSASKKRKSVELQRGISGDVCRGDHSKRVCDSKQLEIPVVPPIDMKKGGPRSSLYALCKKLLWPMPAFDTKEQKSRTPIQFGDTTGFCSFESEISLTIPDFGVIKLTGEARGDKKSSFDSAAVLMMYELERLGKIRICND